MVRLFEVLYGKILCALGFHKGWVRENGQIVCVRKGCKYRWTETKGTYTFKDRY